MTKHFQSLLLLLSGIFIFTENGSCKFCAKGLFCDASKISSLKFLFNTLEAMSFVKTILIEPEPSYSLDETLRSQPHPSCSLHLLGQVSYIIDLHLLHLLTSPELLYTVVIISFKLTLLTGLFIDSIFGFQIYSL